MAKIQVTKTIPERKETVTVKLKCDSCGRDSAFRNNWINDSTEFSEVTISKSTGHRYYSGDYDYIVTSYDFCPDCFDKIAIFFSAKPTEEEVSSS